MADASATGKGSLYIVATPIGNREDMSQRAIRILQEVDVIYAEDTRHSGNLLNALGIKNNLQSLHAHNEADKSALIIAGILQGHSYALISDAGTPLISDPGFPLVKLAHNKGISVIPIPGPCALVTALSAAGVPCDAFTFIGFLPAKQAARQDKLKSMYSLSQTLVFYESTHRILDCVTDIGTTLGSNVDFVVAKELTKTFEGFIRGTSEEISQWLLTDPARCKGEFVLIIPPKLLANDDYQQEQNILSILLEELPLKQAVKIATQITGGYKNDLYKMALELNKE